LDIVREAVAEQAEAGTRGRARYRSNVPSRELKYYALEEEWQSLLRRVVDLPAADQFKVFHALTDYLGGDLWQADARAREVRRPRRSKRCGWPRNT
jgi:hypothetical protein